MAFQFFDCNLAHQQFHLRISFGHVLNFNHHSQRNILCCNTDFFTKNLFVKVILILPIHSESISLWFEVYQPLIYLGQHQNYLQGVGLLQSKFKKKKKIPGNLDKFRIALKFLSTHPSILGFLSITSDCVLTRFVDELDSFCFIILKGQYCPQSFAKTIMEGLNCFSFEEIWIYK